MECLFTLGIWTFELTIVSWLEVECRGWIETLALALIIEGKEKENCQEDNYKLVYEARKIKKDQMKIR